jgi:pimeloyl-ACP methyl ester carboxylesterase
MIRAIRKSPRVRIALVLVGAIVAGGVGMAVRGAEQPFEPLAAGATTVTTADGVDLAATVSGRGNRAVILAEMAASDQDSWRPLTRSAGSLPFTIVTFDFRGQGRSGGAPNLLPFDLAVTQRDMDAVYALLRRHGYRSITCIGASIGGTGCYLLARKPRIAGLGILASQPPSGATVDYLHGLTYPKLFVVAKADTDLVWSVEHMAQGAPGPKALVEFDGSAHATNIFRTPEGPRLRAALLAFLKGIGS